MARKAKPYTERLKWLHQARFGIFIHFGPYSLLGRGEWVMFAEKIRAQDYAKRARRFNPRRFDMLAKPPHPAVTVIKIRFAGQPLPSELPAVWIT